ncbi:MAG: hypothetical protein FWG93_06925 [Oscillospiraceae bacterium]|nr:hypothetical protein [Oscillospiraceae bacterium]
MRAYTVIAGVNGVGKSSFSGVLKTERSDLGYIIDVDKIAAENQCGAWDAGKLALSRIREFLARGISFSQETTLSGRRTEKTVMTAKEQGYSVRLFYIGLNTCGESIKRIKNRVEKGGHDVEEDDVNRRFQKRFGDLAKILPLCDEAYLFDNENGFVEVGEYKNGELIVKGDYRPVWLRELQKALQSPPA